MSQSAREPLDRWVARTDPILPTLRVLAVAAASFATVLAATSTTAASPKVQGGPDPKQVARTVEQYCKSIPNYEPGDLIWRGQLADLPPRLVALGVSRDTIDGILATTLEDQNWLVEQLRTKPGRKFMREVKGYPLAFDRLDRLARMPQGHDTIRALIKGPDGAKLLEYLGTSSGGAQLGKMLSRTPEGAHFNRPTGRVYTAEQLIERLHSAGLPSATRR